MSSALEAKIVVLGSQGVGKTSLVMRYCKGAFDPSQITSTVGASFMTKRVVDSDTDTVVRLQIWDTGMSPTILSASLPWPIPFHHPWVFGGFLLTHHHPPPQPAKSASDRYPDSTTAARTPAFFATALRMLNPSPTWANG